MVLKMGLDRPVQSVQLRTSALSRSVLWKNRKLGKSDKKPETGGSTVKTTNQSGWISFGPIPLIPKLRRFYSFFLNLKPIFFIFSLPFSILTPLLPFSLCLSVSHSHVLTSSFSQSHLRHFGLDLSLSRFLTSQSHFRHDLTSAAHSLDLSPTHLSGSRSHRRLSLLLAIPPLLTISPLPHACDLTTTAHPRSLSPTNPAKGHDTPIKLSLSLSLPLSNFGLLVVFLFPHIFSVIWCLLGCWSAGVICKLVCIYLYMWCNLFDIWFYCRIVICIV